MSPVGFYRPILTLSMRAFGPRNSAYAFWTTTDIPTYIYHAKSRLNTPVWGSLRSPNYSSVVTFKLSVSPPPRKILDPSQFNVFIGSYDTQCLIQRGLGLPTPKQSPLPSKPPGVHINYIMSCQGLIQGQGGGGGTYHQLHTLRLIFFLVWRKGNILIA